MQGSRASSVGRRRDGRIKAPREHGFWVLLSLSLGAGIFVQPSVVSAGVAAVMALVAIGGAMLVGRAIRKNGILQAFSATVIPLLGGAVIFLGGGTWNQALRITLPLAIAFLSGTLCVRAILERARRAPVRYKIAASGSVVLPVLSCVVLGLSGGFFQAVALAVTAIYAIALWLTSPSAKQMRRVGLSISLAHFVSVVLLVVGN